MGLIWGVVAATTAARSEAVAAVWPGVHMVPMMTITITMISGICRLSITSCFVGLVGGVLVKLPPIRYAKVSHRQESRRLVCCAVPVSQADLVSDRPDVAGF